MNRRRLIQSATALAAGLVLPPTLAENAAAVERKFTIQLDRTHLSPQTDGWREEWNRWRQTDLQTVAFLRSHLLISQETAWQLALMLNEERPS